MQIDRKPLMVVFWGNGVEGLILFIIVFVLFLWWKKMPFVKDLYQKNTFDENQNETNISKKGVPIKWSIIFLVGGGMSLFVTFVFISIISVEVMGVIQTHDVDENTPNAQEFIHSKLPDLRLHQIIGSLSFHGGIVSLIIAAIMWHRERKREKIIF